MDLAEGPDGAVAASEKDTLAIVKLDEQIETKRQAWPVLENYAWSLDDP